MCHKPSNANSAASGPVVKRTQSFSDITLPCVCKTNALVSVLHGIVYHYKSSNKKHGRRRLPLLPRRGGEIQFGGGGTQYNRKVCWPLPPAPGRRREHEMNKKLTGDEVGGSVGLWNGD